MLYRKEAQQALHDKEERISEIVNTAFDGIITINERGIIETFNPAARNMFGYHEDEVIGQKVNMLMPSPYRDDRGNNRLSKIECVLGTGMSQNASRDQRLAYSFLLYCLVRKNYGLI
ncbi:MAG: PAS domain S-box protein [Gammaproteobacteria bacterium]|nr:PAS domain S-box protein [Gammaproteobacteria bacterium]